MFKNTETFKFPALKKYLQTNCVPRGEAGGAYADQEVPPRVPEVSGIPEAKIFGQKRRFLAFGFWFWLLKLKAE